MRSGLVRSLVFWYAVIVFATFGVLNLAVSGIIGSNNDRSIEEQLRSYQQSSEVFPVSYTHLVDVLMNCQAPSKEQPHESENKERKAIDSRKKKENIFVDVYKRQPGNSGKRPWR